MSEEPKLDPMLEREIQRTSWRLAITPEGQAVGARYDELDRVQAANAFSDRVVEASIKEWAHTHGGSFEFDVDEVKAICLRNQRDGIPPEFIPDSEKRQ